MGIKTKSVPGFIRGKTLRVTRLDQCGAPVPGADSVVCSKGYTQIAYTANIEDGEAINIKNADDETQIFQPAEPRFINYTVELTFTRVDPDVFALMTGQRKLLDHSGNVIGFTVDSAVKPSDISFAMETWVGTPSGAACGGSGEQQYGLIVLPFTQGGTVGDFTLQNGEITFTVSGCTTKDGNKFGNGLHKIVKNASNVASLMAQSLTSTEHMALLLTTMEPPAPYIGARPYLAPNAVALTSATATVSHLDVTFAPVPAGADPFWVDLGDGTWDYSDDGTALTVAYGAAGTYPYTVYRGSTSYSGSVTTTP